MACEIKKKGDWADLGAKIKALPFMLEKSGRMAMNNAAELFAKDIKTAILRGDVQPADGSFSAEEYASRIRNIPVGQNERFVGIMKGTIVESKVIDSDIIRLEYENILTLGTWRKTILRFQRKWDSVVNQRAMTDLLKWWAS